LERDKIKCQAGNESRKGPTGRKDKSPEICTFEQYYQQKESSERQEVKYPIDAIKNNRAISKNSAVFRSILVQMNDRVKHSKISKGRRGEGDEEDNTQFQSLATSTSHAKGFSKKT
jgi:hypothetical protein